MIGRREKKKKKNGDFLSDDVEIGLQISVLTKSSKGATISSSAVKIRGAPVCSPQVAQNNLQLVAERAERYALHP